MQNDVFEDSVQEKLSVFLPYLEELDGALKELMIDAFYDYCRVSVMLDDVVEKVIKTGTTIENNKGNIQKNPDITTMHQLVNEKNALLPKIIKHLPEQTREKIDELTEFLR